MFMAPVTAPVLVRPTPTGGRYTMECKTKAALTKWANDQTMPEIAAYYNGLPGVKPVKKFESREVAVTRI